MGTRGWRGIGYRREAASRPACSHHHAACPFPARRPPHNTCKFAAASHQSPPPPRPHTHHHPPSPTLPAFIPQPRLPLLHRPHVVLALTPIVSTSSLPSPSFHLVFSTFVVWSSISPSSLLCLVCLRLCCPRRRVLFTGYRSLGTGVLLTGYRCVVHWVQLCCSLGTGVLFTEYSCVVHGAQLCCLLGTGVLFTGYNCVVHWVPVCCSLGTGVLFMGYRYVLHWVPVCCSWGTDVLFTGYRSGERVVRGRAGLKVVG